MSSLKHTCLTILIFCFTFTLFSFSDSRYFSDPIYTPPEVQSSQPYYDPEYSSNATMKTFDCYNRDITVRTPTDNGRKCYKGMPTSRSASPLLSHSENQFSSNATSQPTIISTAPTSVSITTFNIPNRSEGPLIISPI